LWLVDGAPPAAGKHPRTSPKSTAEDKSFLHKVELTKTQKRTPAKVSTTSPARLSDSSDFFAYGLSLALEYRL
jgi:hypothetical protein